MKLPGAQFADAAPLSAGVVTTPAVVASRARLCTEMADLPEPGGSTSDWCWQDAVLPIAQELHKSKKPNLLSWA